VLTTSDLLLIESFGHVAKAFLAISVMQAKSVFVYLANVGIEKPANSTYQLLQSYKSI
jgi:hypothetical protein